MSKNDNKKQRIAEYNSKPPNQTKNPRLVVDFTKY